MEVTMDSCKKRRIATDTTDGCLKDDADEWAPCTPQHPCGVRPGSAFTSVIGDRDDTPSSVLDRNTGLGLLAQLPDDVVLHILSQLEPASLTLLALTSKVFFAFVYDDTLWKRHVEELVSTHCKLVGETRMRFYKSWKVTYFLLSSSATVFSLDWTPAVLSVRCSGKFVEIGDRHQLFLNTVLYSDTLYKRWMLGTIALDNPVWCEYENVDRRGGLSRAEFIREYERASRPVIFTDVVTKWPSFQSWSRDAMLEKYKDVRFKVSGKQMTLQDFFHYSEAATDDRPLYLFDSKFANKCPEFADGYTPPMYFDDDFFRLLASTHADVEGGVNTTASSPRPDYRWFIIGPRRSGSSFHVDPNGTCAWSAMFSGRKKWILYPPHVLPPGVEIDTSSGGDGGFITTTSLVDWLLTYYPTIHDVPPSERPVECVTKAGELMFVPSGWWYRPRVNTFSKRASQLHCVVNIDESVAITHNVITEHNLISAIDLLAQPVHCPPGSCRGDVMGDVPLWVAMGGGTSSTQTVSGDATPSTISQGEALDSSEHTNDATVRVAMDEAARLADSIGTDRSDDTNVTPSVTGTFPSNAPSLPSEECACDHAKQRLLKRFRAALEHEKPGLEAKLRREEEGTSTVENGTSHCDGGTGEKPKTLWDRMKDSSGAADTNTTNTPGAFSFGF